MSDLIDVATYAGLLLVGWWICLILYLIIRSIFVDDDD